ncbi:hypothetical protein VTK56DRAFT_5170 [Thermocarpiscus australiensis]
MSFLLPQAPPLSSSLALGSRIGLRYASWAVKASTRMRYGKGGKYKIPPKYPEQEPPKPPKEDHGERLWIFNHIEANYIVYSTTPVLKKAKAIRQLPYTGKKLMPYKVRKDYWRQIAAVNFGPGQGEVGRSVFQKLRELKKRHALEWEDEKLLHMSRHERGVALNDQRANMVADLAAVLAGKGKGNKMVISDEEEEEEKMHVMSDGSEEEEVVVEEGKGEKTPRLHPAVVYWANEQDRYYAVWSKNVTHVVGLPEIRKPSPEEERGTKKKGKKKKSGAESKPAGEISEAAAEGV